SGDGRNVDPSLGVLEGEGAEQATPSDRVVTKGGPPLEVWDRMPSSDGGGRDDPTYFDRPVLKRPVWKWYVPAYFAVGGAAGAAGLRLAGYTAVLVANTAVPVWQGARRTAPPVFVASAMSAAASLLQLMKLTDREERIVRRFAVMGAAADLASEFALEREAGRVERVARSLPEGRSGALLT